ncbi:MAG: hypothetical protein GPI96_14245 [Microcystis aeruginosa BS13-02]|uniref:Uncharacterized protein n=1 Tax=Microcystis aeruginosa Ma_MB_S_20031200_S102 TaxID=2486254 RepID=A0A552EPN2_MICAE|nr:hypothetical protein [Microcystis aeruginosa]MDB9418065.1 hypothetical protein [Microcystis aeruginosa CS-556/03]NCS25593.1 hypothetical protein [Microcystis aeruginosa BS13-02]TRU29454.1 MAG: hypothetical protein EWV79_00460 [Microcystis aeruginosa Ma_MB_S_20031200_S102D]TRU36396.1 MAG: hypothetical protein EWV92_12405 [Microcystis aeruginosa Ma_MB_S_20031200_S102]
MLKTIEDVYRDGQIHLTELPNDISDRSQVLVTFLDQIDPIAILNYFQKSDKTTPVFRFMSCNGWGL